MISLTLAFLFADQNLMAPNVRAQALTPTREHL
jgi:hypothetical protein